MDYLFKDVKIEFILKINDEEIKVEPEIMMLLAANKDGCLNHFLAGYFKEYPKNEYKYKPWEEL